MPEFDDIVSTVSGWPLADPPETDLDVQIYAAKKSFEDPILLRASRFYFEQHPLSFFIRGTVRLVVGHIQDEVARLPPRTGGAERPR